MTKPTAYMNWSGGKDSALALNKILKENKLQINYLLTSINKVYDRISMHGVRRQLLEAQCKAIGIPLKTIELPEQPDMQEYEQEMGKKVKELTDAGIHKTIFGDIFLQDLREYREDKLRPMGITCEFPLWNIPTKQLIEQFIAEGFKAVIVCVNAKHLDKSFCGRTIDHSFLTDLPATVDPCGENGEYHSFVFDGPIFSKPIAFQKGEIVLREYKQGIENPGFYFCDLLPVETVQTTIPAAQSKLPAAQ